MQTGARISALLAILAVVGTSASAAVKTFRTVPTDERNVVQFISDAPMEKIVGRTTKIAGMVDFDPNDVLSTSRAEFSVDLNLMDTGIALRNQHMRENYLETAKYPNAVFTLERVISSDKKSLASGETAKVVVEGNLSLHGVTKSYQIPVTIYYSTPNQATEMRLDGAKGDLLLVNAEWTVKLSDHKIPRPEFLFLKLSEEQKVSISAGLTDQLPPAK